MNRILPTLTHALGLLATAAPAPLVLAVILYAGSVVLAAWRWQLVLRAMGLRSRLSHTMLGTLGGIFVNNVTPASRVGGEAYRTAYIKAKSKIGVAPAAGSIALDRCFDLPAFGLVFIVALPTVWPLLRRANDLALGAGIAVAVALAVVLAYRLLPRVRAAVGRIKPHVAAAAGDRGALALAALPAVLVWVQDVLRLQLVASAVGVELDVQRAAALAVLATLGGLVPTIGGVGAVEGGLTAGLVLFGVPLETALTVALLERSISFVLSTVVGGVAAFAHGGGRVWRFVRSPSSATGTIPSSVG